MSLTPHRDAALASALLVEKQIAANRGSDPIVSLGEDMSLATVKAVMLGTADMMDRGVSPGLAALHANRSLAAVLASVLLSFHNGRTDVALLALTSALVDLQVQTRERLLSGDGHGTQASVRSSQPQGNA